MTPQKVSQILREGGLPKASGYRSFGREVEGFLVMKPGTMDAATVVAVVHVTPTHTAGRQMYESAQAILDAAGVPHEPYGRPGVGGTYALRVPKEES